MTKLQSWTMAGLGAAALAVGALLAGMAVTVAQDLTPTPAPTATADEGADSEGSTPGEDSNDAARVRGCGGGKYLVKEAAAKALGLSEDALLSALRDGQSLAEIAEAQGMSVDDFKAALIENVTAALQAQLDAGDITQEEFDRAIAEINENIDDIINAEGGFGHGFRFGHPGHPLRIVDAAAAVLGLSEDDLLSALRDGQTLAEIAEGQGMSVDDFKAALIENITASLQAELDAGDITQEQFDAITADLDEKVDHIINAAGGPRFHHGPPEGGFPGGDLRFRAPFGPAPLGSGT